MTNRQEELEEPTGRGELVIVRGKRAAEGRFDPGKRRIADEFEEDRY